jgi:hypothetical protein
MRSTPATSRQVSARAMSTDRRGAEPPLSPIALPTSRLVDSAGFDPAPHPYIGKSATGGYNFRPSSHATARPRVGAFAASVGRYRGPLAQVSSTFRSPRDEWRGCAVVQIDAETLEVELPHNSPRSKPVWNEIFTCASGSRSTNGRGWSTSRSSSLARLVVRLTTSEACGDVPFAWSNR